MKEECWKGLRSQLCPRHKWVSDSQHSRCQCCSKQFRFLVRPRHHCRFCGNLFCSDCSDYFINGKYIGDVKEKFIRHCEFCHKKIEKLTKEWTKTPEIYEEKTEPQTEININEDEEIEEDEEEEEDECQVPFNVNKMFEQAEKNSCEHNQMLTEKQNKILNDAASALCLEYCLSQQIWRDKLVNLAQRAANQVKMEVIVAQGKSKDQMDIVQKVKVKTILTEKNQAIQAMVKGIVFEKNATSKSMQTHLSKPKVLVIQGSIDLDSLASFVKFEELIKNDKAILKKILEKITKLNPDIVFVENNVHVFALEYFQSKSIVVVNKLKQSQLKMIKWVSGIKKSVKKIWMIETLKVQNILGKCDKIYFKTIKEGQMMMFIESGDMGIRTILLGEQTEEQNSHLNKSIQFLMRLARQINLQKHFILIEKKLKNGICKKDSILPTVDDFNKNFYKDIEAFSKCQNMLFSKIAFYSVKLSQSPKNFQQYAQRMGKTSYKQICGSVEIVYKKIYSDDLTLADYILRHEKQCKRCLSNHQEYFYIGDYVVIVSTERKANSSISKSSSNSVAEAKNEEENTLDKNKNLFMKQKKQIMISIHAQCEVCRSVVGLENTKVGIFYLSNSFHHILRNLVQWYDYSLKQYQQDKVLDDDASVLNSKKVSKRKLSMDKCDHSILERVYNYADLEIRISINKVYMYTINYIDLKEKSSIEHMKNKEIAYIKSLYESEISEKKRILDIVSNQLSSLSFPNNPNSSFVGGQKFQLYFKSCIKLNKVVEKSKEFLAKVEQRINKISKNGQHDWTINIRQILKVQSILNLILYIIDEVEKNLHKKKSDELQNSIILENSEFLQKNETEDSTLDPSLSMAVSNPRASSAQSYFPYLDEETKQYLKRKSRKLFPMFECSPFKFPTAYISDPVSLLAMGVNSVEYQRVLVEEAMNMTEFTVQIPGLRFLATEWEIRKDAQKVYNDIVGELNYKNQTISITVYFPYEFETFRKMEGIDHELYVRALCTCKSWDSSGGKSNSLFAKAQNDLLVVKVINEKEFDEFLKFAKDYIDYMKSLNKSNNETLLAKVFGIYQVSSKNKIYKCIVMQNIFFGLQNITKVYDLKGSQVNRLTLPPEGVKSFTGQDTNFKIDKQGEPYVIPAHQYDKIIKILDQDSIFLRQHAVIDYSLLVIESGCSLRLGIIDYMRPYQLMEKLQTFYKEFKSGRDPTVIPPNSYADRFISAMKRYFIKTQ